MLRYQIPLVCLPGRLPRLVTRLDDDTLMPLERPEHPSLRPGNFEAPADNTQQKQKHSCASLLTEARKVSGGRQVDCPKKNPPLPFIHCCFLVISSYSSHRSESKAFGSWQQSLALPPLLSG